MVRGWVWGAITAGTGPESSDFRRESENCLSLVHIARYTVQLAGFTGVWGCCWYVDRTTVTLEPPSEVIEEAAEWYERERPEGDRAEMIERRVLDLVNLEVQVGTG